MGVSNLFEKEKLLIINEIITNEQRTNKNTDSISSSEIVTPIINKEDPSIKIENRIDPLLNIENKYKIDSICKLKEYYD